MVEDRRDAGKASETRADQDPAATDIVLSARPSPFDGQAGPSSAHRFGVTAPPSDDGPFVVLPAGQPRGSAASVSRDVARSTALEAPLIRLLILGDSGDAEAAAIALRSAGFHFIAKRADTPSGFTRELNEFLPDLVLAAAALPTNGGRPALDEIYRAHPAIPVIVMGGNVGVEDAIDLLKAGARDYVAADRLSRLGPAVLAALDWAERCRSQRREAQTLRVSEIRYRRLFEAARDGILILDAAKGKILDVNPFMEKLLGYTRAEFLGKTLWEIGAFKDIAANISAFAELQSREYMRYENLPLETKDGRMAEVEFVSNVYREHDRDVIQCNIRDISERKMVEKLLFQSQKMEAFGILAGGMAHNINNTLGIIVGNLDSLRPMLPAGGDAAGLAAGALDAAMSGGELTRQLLDFAHNQPLQRECVAVNRTIADTAKLLRSTIGTDIVLSLELQSDAWLVAADPVQLQTSLVNLANNARQAMPHGGRLQISSRNCNLDAQYVAARAGVRPGDYVAIAVTDEGCGIPAAISGRIFEPFFTTQKGGKGTGLGLSTVFAFAKQSRGHVEFDSKDGAGSTFRIYLPRADEAALAAAQLPSSSLGPGGSETVLVVEDNPAMRRVALRQVRDLGYRVLEADCAAAALDLLATEKVDVLFTDIMMPGGMTGLELARLATERTPSLKVVVTSGYSAADIEGADVLLLSKPFRRNDLARALRAALDARADKMGRNLTSPQSKGSP